MDNKKIRAIGAAVLVVVWLGLTAFAWFSPAKEASDAERRPLVQMPQITLQSILDGKFMGEFEDYSLDQFPLRDSFRQIKSLFHYYALRQGDNNDIYLAEGYAAKLEYPMDETSVSYALAKFNAIYEKHLKESDGRIYTCVVPDKSYYLAEKNGYLAMDYEAMFTAFQEGMPWSEYVDITDCLDRDSYYRTDTHWRQEKLLGVAQKLSQAMGLTAPKAEDFTAVKVEKPFYGVYYGQAALPMEPEELYIMQSPVLKGCTVTNHETGKKTSVYDMEKLNAKDLYEVYLSGPVALMTVENPNAASDRELIVFRDSFGSSIVPLLVNDYKTVTLVDIRYLPTVRLEMFVDFHGQDVLFLYSTLVLNASSSLK